jgi:hypothetical protein
LVATSGVVVSGLHPARHGADFGFLDFLCFVCAEAPVAIARQNSAATAIAQNFRVEFRRTKKTFSGALVPVSRDCVRIFAKRAGVAFRENFHHPPVKIIDWMVHDGFESTVVFAVSFLNVVFQSDAQILIFAALAYLVRM